MANRVLGVRFVSSTQVPTDQGTGNDESCVIAGNFAELYITMRLQASIEILGSLRLDLFAGVSRCAAGRCGLGLREVICETDGHHVRVKAFAPPSSHGDAEGHHGDLPVLLTGFLPSVGGVQSGSLHRHGAAKAGRHSDSSASAVLVLQVSSPHNFLQYRGFHPLPFWGLLPFFPRNKPFLLHCCMPIP